MFSFLKAVFLGAILTFFVAGIIGSTGSSGAFLTIKPIILEGRSIYWSWPMFLAGTGLSWVILALME